MRTIASAPPAVYRRVQGLARQQGRSLSAVIADLTMRGLAQVDAPVELARDEQTGLPVLSLGREVTSTDVAAALDE